TSNQGRWLSPDPIGGDISNPQSLNRYAYVLNNPTNLIDLLGLCPKGTHPATAAEAQDILTAANSFLNQAIEFNDPVPGPNGRSVACDCTGLLYLAISKAGYVVPRTSTGQIHA